MKDSSERLDKLEKLVLEKPEISLKDVRGIYGKRIRSPKSRLKIMYQALTEFTNGNPLNVYYVLADGFKGLIDKDLKHEEIDRSQYKKIVESYHAVRKVAKLQELARKYEMPREGENPDFNEEEIKGISGLKIESPKDCLVLMEKILKYSSRTNPFPVISALARYYSSFARKSKLAEKHPEKFERYYEEKERLLRAAQLQELRLKIKKAKETDANAVVKSGEIEVIYGSKTLDNPHECLRILKEIAKSRINVHCDEIFDLVEHKFIGNIPEDKRSYLKNKEFYDDLKRKHHRIIEEIEEGQSVKVFELARKFRGIKEKKKKMLLDMKKRLEDEAESSETNEDAPTKDLERIERRI